jgi:hypothetical protein
MTDAVDSSTLALVCYPGLWDASCELHPRAAPGYDWRDHLRTLCRLARELHAEQPIALRVAGDSERLHIWALGDVDQELLILDIERDRISRPNLPVDPLWWANPHDPHLKPVKSRSSVGQSRPGAHI